MFFSAEEIRRKIVSEVLRELSCRLLHPRWTHLEIMAIGGEKLNYPAPQHTQGLPRARHPKKGVRVGYSVLENGTKVRVCKKCGASIEE